MRKSKKSIPIGFTFIERSNKIDVYHGNLVGEIITNYGDNCNDSSFIVNDFRSNSNKIYNSLNEAKNYWISNHN